MRSMSLQKFFNETFTRCHSLRVCSLVRTPPSYSYMVHICPGRKRSTKECHFSVQLLKECAIGPFLSVFLAPMSHVYELLEYLQGCKMNCVTVETKIIAMFRRCRGQTRLFQSLTDEIRTFLKSQVTSNSFLLYPLSFTPVAPYRSVYTELHHSQWIFCLLASLVGFIFFSSSS